MPSLASPFPLGDTLSSPFRDDHFAQNLCGALDEVLAPIITTLDSMPAYLDPATAPDDMLGWLAGWMGIALDGHQTAERQREFVRLGVELLQWRGTARGVRTAVDALFDGTSEIIESGGTSVATQAVSALPGSAEQGFVVRLGVADPEGLEVRRLDAVVQMLKPAHVQHRAEVFGMFHPARAQDLKPRYTVPTTVTSRVDELAAEGPSTRQRREETAADRFAFICYSRRDAELVRLLEEDLNRRGIRTWRDSHISIGTTWRNEVRQAIEQCSNFIVVMSEDTPSEEMAIEIEWAKRKKKPLFPLSVNNSVYFELVGKQYVALTTEPLDEEVVRLLIPKD